MAYNPKKFRSIGVGTSDNIIKLKKKFIKKAKVKIIDTTTPKYKVLLKFINKILVNLHKEPINDLTQFKNIDRLDIIKPENKIILEGMAKEIFMHYDKIKSGYYHKSTNIVHNVVRKLVKEVGLSFSSKKKKVYYRKYNSTCVRCAYLYTIKNI